MAPDVDVRTHFSLSEQELTVSFSRRIAAVPGCSSWVYIVCESRWLSHSCSLFVTLDSGWSAALRVTLVVVLVLDN